MADDGDYREQLGAYEQELLTFLRKLESIQENLRPNDIRDHQARLMETIGGLFRRFTADFAERTPPHELSDFHPRFVEAVGNLEKANTLFMTEPSPNWTLAFLHSRRAFCRALYGLYEIRAQIPLLARYFAIEGEAVAADQAPADQAPADQAPDGPPSTAAVGFSHHERTADHGQFSMYVPENYSASKEWPLIICLHGGYGEGFEYIMTWLRPARTKGYILLSPKSLGDTWAMTIGSIDVRSVSRMLEQVARDYRIDRSRIYLTGLSDGGIFTYIMGLEHHELFAGIAPVAGALHLAVDPLLRAGKGKTLPLFVIHGVHDFIFPVQFTRQTNELLRSIGYNLKYEELPDWGHAFTYSINERLVMPWFESLPPRKATADQNPA
jgi:phospholipase/carboxylesterase